MLFYPLAVTVPLQSHELPARHPECCWVHSELGRDADLLWAVSGRNGLCLGSYLSVLRIACRWPYGPFLRQRACRARCLFITGLAYGPVSGCERKASLPFKSISHFFNFPIRAFQDFIKKEPLDSLASPVRYKAILAIRHLR